MNQYMNSLILEHWLAPPGLGVCEMMASIIKSKLSYMNRDINNLTSASTAPCHIHASASSAPTTLVFSVPFPSYVWGIFGHSLSHSQISTPLWISGVWVKVARILVWIRLLSIKPHYVLFGIGWMKNSVICESMKNAGLCFTKQGKGYLLLPKRPRSLRLCTILYLKELQFFPSLCTPDYMENIGTKSSH